MHFVTSVDEFSRRKQHNPDITTNPTQSSSSNYIFTARFDSFLNILTKVLYNICKQKTVAVLFWVEDVYFVGFLAGEKYGYLTAVARCFMSFQFMVIQRDFVTEQVFRCACRRYSCVSVWWNIFIFKAVAVQIVFDLNTRGGLDTYFSNFPHASHRYAFLRISTAVCTGSIIRCILLYRS